MSRAAERTLLRVGGFLAMAVGVVLLAQLVLDWESGAAMELPLVWKAFVSIGLLFVGGACQQAGYLGAASRVVAEETGPATRTTAQNVGMRAEDGPICSACGTRSGAGDRFCRSCSRSVG